MPIIVKKYGGSSIETIDLINRLASRLAYDKRQGSDIVVVVSAMAKTTDYLFDLAKQISDTPFQRELDMLVTAGERISMSLLSIALHKNNIPAISFTGSQSGIITNDCHGNAKIIDVNAFRIKEELKKGKIVIVAGYQGVSRKKEVTTLGRGGSDTTAVALAGYLNAERCQMFKDVEGIYSADPKTVPQACKLKSISYNRMLYLSYSGCKVVHPRAIEFAMKYKIPIEVKSSFNSQDGTLINSEENMDEKKVSAITGKDSLIIYDIETKIPTETTELIRNLCSTIFDFELISGNHIRFAAHKELDVKLHQELSRCACKKYSVTEDVSSISLIGNVFNEEPGLVSDVLTFLNNRSIDCLWMTSNPHGLTCYIKIQNNNELLNDLHEAFIEHQC